MIKHKIVIRRVNLPDVVKTNNFNTTDGYLTYNLSKIEQGILVDEFNVLQFLEDSNNSNIVEKFIKYLKQYTNDLEFKEIFYKPKKVAPILNDFYNEEIRFNSEANPILIFNALKNTETIFYQNNYFNFSNNQRILSESESMLFESLSADTTYKDYYIDVKIDLKESFIYGNDYLKYLKDIKENDIIYKNSFVDLNNKIDPFEYWKNEKVTKVWNTSTSNVIDETYKKDKERVDELERIALDFEKRAEEIKNKRSIKYIILRRKAKKARKVFEIEKAKLIRKTKK